MFGDVSRILRLEPASGSKNFRAKLDKLEQVTARSRTLTEVKGFLLKWESVICFMSFIYCSCDFKMFSPSG